jgi:hypothetical protein
MSHSGSKTFGYCKNHAEIKEIGICSVDGQFLKPWQMSIIESAAGLNK